MITKSVLRKSDLSYVGVTDPFGQPLGAVFSVILDSEFSGVSEWSTVEFPSIADAATQVLRWDAQMPSTRGGYRVATGYLPRNAAAVDAIILAAETVERRARLR